ncbi:MAG TPA: O-antigen ligase family protein [Bryobacteraceae bacterium]|nr:O-antigen ligase family protein [Bryobacteraceae bacterium]
MIAGLRAPLRREALLGAGLGGYAALAALAPSIAAKAVLCAPLIAIPIAWPMLRKPRLWLALFFAAALLLPPLPIHLGDSGPHVALVFAGAGLFIGLLRLAEWRIEINSIGGCLLALFAIVFASLAMALIYSGVSIAAGSLARVCLLGISVYVYFYVRSGPGRIPGFEGFRWIRLLFCAAALSALFACVDFYYQFPAPAGYEQQFIWVDTGVFRRAQGIFYEASTLGNLCAFFLEMVAVALFRPRGAQSLSLFSLLAGASALAWALVLSYSRGSLINVAVALIVLLWFQRHRVRWNRVLAGAAALVGLLALLAIFSPVFSGAYWQRVTVGFQFFNESPDVILSGRVQSWRVLLDFLQAHSWYALLGVGYKTLPYSDFIGTTAVGDNTYLTLLAETGILGLAAVIALNVAILRRSYRAAHSTDDLRSFCGLWMLCFWSGQAVQMLSADLLTYWRILPVYFFVLALAA